jgi:ATP adenylyltransferase
MDHLWTPWRMPYLRGESTHPDHCVFCHKIEADDEAEFVVFRSEHVFATLNLYPYNNGHLLIVPYAHVATLEELPVAALADLMETAREALSALRTTYKPEGFNVGFNIGPAAGAGIAEHLHMHIVPRWPGDTNYITVVGQTRVIPDMLTDTFRQLRKAWPTRDT